MGGDWILFGSSSCEPSKGREGGRVNDTARRLKSCRVTYNSSERIRAGELIVNKVALGPNKKLGKKPQETPE